MAIWYVVNVFSMGRRSRPVRVVFSVPIARFTFSRSSDSIVDGAGGFDLSRSARYEAVVLRMMSLRGVLIVTTPDGLAWGTPSW